MLVSLLFTPLVALVPVVATAGVLVYVGFLLLPRDDFRLGRFTPYDAIVGLVMAAISFLTFSLDKAMVNWVWRICHPTSVQQGREG